MTARMERVISAARWRLIVPRASSAAASFSPGSDHAVVIVDERPIREHLLRLIERLVRVICERALVEAVHFRQGRSVAEQYVEELERFDMPPHDDEAERQRRGEDQADRAPNPRPEDGRDNDGHGRQSGGVAVEQWLDHIPGERFDDHEQQRHVDCRPPAGIDGRRKRQRGNRRQQRPDVWDEPEQTCQHAPERCGRYADQPESHSDHHTEAGIHAQLRHEVSAEALARIVHRDCRPVQIRGAKEAYEPVAQVLALHQNENRNDQAQ